MKIIFKEKLSSRIESTRAETTEAENVITDEDAQVKRAVGRNFQCVTLVQDSLAVFQILHIHKLLLIKTANIFAVFL